MIVHSAGFSFLFLCSTSHNNNVATLNGHLQHNYLNTYAYNILNLHILYSFNKNLYVLRYWYLNEFFYRFRFWQWGHWIEVRVDDRLPTRGDRPIYMHCAQPDVFWAALLEKAYAK